MHPNKAIAIDGFGLAFSQWFWSSVFPMILECGGIKCNKSVSWIYNKELSEGRNDTTLVLITKKKEPNRMSFLQPISLCNVIYKVMEKVFANRLKILLPTIVLENQYTFVVGHYITDSIIIAHEMNHLLTRQRTATTGTMDFKLNISKAYDKLDLFGGNNEKNGFFEDQISLVMMCARTA